MKKRRLCQMEQWMQERGMSQTELAFHTGIVQPLISKGLNKGEWSERSLRKLEAFWRTRRTRLLAEVNENV